MVELHAFGDVPFKSHKTGLVNLILIFLFSLLPHTASVSCQVEKVKKPVHTKDLLASKGAVGGAGSWLSPPFLLPSLEGQASCPSRPSASPRSAARPWPRRRRARRPRPRPRKGGGKSRREGGGNGGKHKNIGAEQPLEVPEPSPCPQDQGCTRPGADRSVLDSGRKVPDGCHVLGGQRALTLVGWAVWFLFHRFLGVLILTSPNPQLLYLLDAVQDGIRQPNLRFTFSLTLCVGRVAQQILEPGTGTCCVCHCWGEKQSLGEC
ncbi:uncharacterized protein LOC121347843 isoform X2 [Onychostruthus taczanowskii]|uniref:uncharacterized protein LOC121347843 isoform X2 n=1 Tax=Onychostruthus taczanowskii TaxID=356909 RepID=UPI001B7FF65A|nr:uncharacterized protein LOC121347843 isoform X2 [Onychostruthus taczanowskii]